MPPADRSEWRVSRVYDYHDRTVAVYTYDDAGRLLRMKHSDHTSIPGLERTTLFVFEYDEERAVSMRKTSPDGPEFDYESTFTYDAQGLMIREEQRGLTREWIIDTHFEADDRGRICCQTDTDAPDGGRNFIMSYNDAGDVERMFIYYPNAPMEQGWSTGTTHYEYELHPKPNFGIDALFTVEPLPYFGNAATWQRLLSAHNLTHMDGDLLWEYTYNEAGLPATVESFWPGSETAEPMLLRLEYVKMEISQ